MNFTTVSDFYKSLFNCKVYKICIDAGCTCPNRDGSKGTGGCIFCSQNGSGDFITQKTDSIENQINEAKKIVDKKFNKHSEKKYIVYFQNFTNTYGDEELLLNKFTKAIQEKDIVGIAIGTRPDCLSDSMLQKLAELSNRTFIQLELGLQTTDEKTALLINRCYKTDFYFDAIKRIRTIAPKIHIVTHLIFGLPEESKETMFKSLDDVINCYKENNFSEKAFGIKITVLYVLSDTKLEEFYNQKKYTSLSFQEYFNLIKEALNHIDKKIVIHRITGDPPKKFLISPEWTCDKKRVLNAFKTLLQ